MKKKPKRHNASQNTKDNEPKHEANSSSNTSRATERDKSRSGSRHRRSLSSLFRRQNGEKRSKSGGHSSRDRSNITENADESLEVRLKPREHFGRLTVREALLESRSRGRSPHRRTVKLERLILDNTDSSDLVENIEHAPEVTSGKELNQRYETFPRLKKRRVASDTRVLMDATKELLPRTINDSNSQNLPLDKRKYIIDPANRREGLDSLQSIGLFTSAQSGSLLQPQSPTHSSHDTFPFHSADPEEEKKRRDSFLQFLYLRDKKPSRSPLSHGVPSEPTTPIAENAPSFFGDNESRQSAFSVVSPSHTFNLHTEKRHSPLSVADTYALPGNMSQPVILSTNVGNNNLTRSNSSLSRPIVDNVFDDVAGDSKPEESNTNVRQRKSSSKSPRGSYVSPRRFTRTSRSSVTSNSSTVTDLDLSQPNTPSVSKDEPHVSGRYHRQFSSSSEKRRRMERECGNKNDVKEPALSELTVKTQNKNIISSESTIQPLQKPIESGVGCKSGTCESSYTKTKPGLSTEPCLILDSSTPILRPIPVREGNGDSLITPVIVNTHESTNILISHALKDKDLMKTVEMPDSDEKVQTNFIHDDSKITSPKQTPVEIQTSISKAFDSATQNEDHSQYRINKNVFEPIRDTETEAVSLADVFHESDTLAKETIIDEVKNIEQTITKAVVDEGACKSQTSKDKTKSKESKTKNKKEKKKKENKVKDKIKEKKAKVDNAKAKTSDTLNYNIEVAKPDLKACEVVSPLVKEGDTAKQDGAADVKLDNKKSKSKKSMKKERNKSKERETSKENENKTKKGKLQSTSSRSDKHDTVDNTCATTPCEESAREQAVKSDEKHKDNIDKPLKPELNKSARLPSKSELNRSRKKQKDKKKDAKMLKCASGSEIEVKMVRSSSLCDIKDAEQTIEKKHLQRSRSVVTKRRHQRIDEDMIRRHRALRQGHATKLSHAEKSDIKTSAKAEIKKVQNQDLPHPKLSLTAVIAMKTGLVRMRKARERARMLQALQEQANGQDGLGPHESEKTATDENDDARVAKVVYENEVNASIRKRTDLSETELIEDEIISADKEVKDIVYDRKIHFLYNDDSISEEELIKQRQRNTRLTGRRESKVRQRQKRVINCLKQFVAFLFSHIGLCTLVVAYCILGGFIFRELEGAAEMKEKKEMEQLRQNFRDEIYRLSFEKHIMNEKENDEFRGEIERILKDYSENIHARITEGGWDGKDSADQPEQWSFPSSLLYAITVMTTIGYGHVAPKTDVGRIVTIAYAVLGIPLTLLCLTNIGDVMAHGFRMLYGKFFCGLCCILFRPARRKRLDPEKGLAPGEERMMLQEEDKTAEVKNVPTSVCLLLMTAYIMLGTLLFAKWEQWDAVTGTYFCFITLSTIGFGDVVPGISSKNWDNEKLILCAMYLVFGLSLIAMCFNLVQEDVKGKCKWLGMKLGIIDKPVAPQL